MGGMVWKVRMQREVLPWKGQPVLCVWNRERQSYEVFHRGSLCGIVKEPFTGRTGGLLSGRIVGRDGMEMDVMVNEKKAAVSLLPMGVMPAVNCRRAA